MYFNKWYQDLVHYRYLQGELQELEQFLPVAA